jgi:DNA-binding CsgD family transcriptional regulator/tetratricopeptide (TPR) repeat protein
VYCSVLEGCSEVLDLRRAQEWTSELKKWCDAQPDIVPYRAACLAHRAAVLQWCGEWTDALEEASRACELLAHPVPRRGLHAAYYQVAEIHRLRGNLVEAERAYEQASQLHADPGPGQALLWLAKGKPDKAIAVIRRVLEHAREAGQRALVLDAFVEIALACDDIAAARAASDELAEIALRMGFPLLRALSLRAEGQVLLRAGDAGGALRRLQHSWTLWGELQVPYESARVRCLIAHTRRALGDEENARIELEAARSGFEQLGAVVDLACVNDFLLTAPPRGAGPLTDREVEVLRLVAGGHTNRGVAEQLHISEKTVARHLSNIFTKLDLESRTAATVYALEHKLV